MPKLWKLVGAFLTHPVVYVAL